MRKHDVRKWLHAVLDLLPVILIPVFMIYSHRHTIDSGTIDVPQNQVVDFNQKSKNVITQYTDQYGWYGSQTELVLNDGIFEATPVTNADFPGIVSPMIKSTATHVYVISCYFKGATALHLNFGGYDAPIGTNLNVNDFTYIDFRLQTTLTNDHGLALFVPTAVVPDITIEFYNKINVFDLTQMFGSGNEPSLQQFRQWYPSDYYDFTLSRKELLKGTSTITYDDSDIMSQSVYQLYNSVDKYFNMGNVFNMTGVYDWFNLNIFNGNAPISIYIVWNIVLYEFVMDLLFLLYGLFMWFIDMVEKLMEKPLKSVK